VTKQIKKTNNNFNLRTDKRKMSEEEIRKLISEIRISENSTEDKEGILGCFHMEDFKDLWGGK